MVSLWKLPFLVQMFCSLLLIEATEIMSEVKKRNEDSIENEEEPDTSASSYLQSRDSSFVKFFPQNHQVNGYKYDLNRLHHKVDQLILAIRQITQSCPCAKGISLPVCSNPLSKECRPFGHGQSGGSTESNHWSGSSEGHHWGGSSGISGGNHGISQIGGSFGPNHWGSSTGISEGNNGISQIGGSSGHNHWGGSSGISDGNHGISQIGDSSGHNHWGGSSGISEGNHGISQIGSSSGHNHWGSSSGISEGNHGISQIGGNSGSNHWGSSSGIIGGNHGISQIGGSSSPSHWGSSSGKWVWTGSSGSGHHGTGQIGGSGGHWVWIDSFSGNGHWGGSSSGSQGWGSTIYGHGPKSPTSCHKKSFGNLIYGSHIRPKNCGDLRKMGYRNSGIQTIYPFSNSPRTCLSVYCDQATDNGGWTTILLRRPVQNREKFSRSWYDYEQGFGDLRGEYWLGLRNIHALTQSSCMELMIEMEDFGKHRKQAKYQEFKIGNKYQGYKLWIDGYSGNAGDSLSYSNGAPFSTKDRDNDKHDTNCAFKFKGGWWYNRCFKGKLTGFPYHGPHKSYADGINWHTFKGYKYSLRIAAMKIRPTSCRDNYHHSHWHSHSSNNGWPSNHGFSSSSLNRVEDHQSEQVKISTTEQKKSSSGA